MKWQLRAFSEKIDAKHGLPPALLPPSTDRRQLYPGPDLHGGHVLSAVAELVGVDRGPEWFGREAYRALLA